MNEFYDNTLQTRLNQKLTGAIVIIIQRLHQDDLVGHVLERDPGGWTVVSVPAIENTELGRAINMVKVQHRGRYPPHLVFADRRSSRRHSRLCGRNNRALTGQRCLKSET